jgi:hypothetical protein
MCLEAHPPARPFSRRRAVFVVSARLTPRAGLRFGVSPPAGRRAAPALSAGARGAVRPIGRDGLVEGRMLVRLAATGCPTGVPNPMTQHDQRTSHRPGYSHRAPFDRRTVHSGHSNDLAFRNLQVTALLRVRRQGLEPRTRGSRGQRSRIRSTTTSDSAVMRNAAEKQRRQDSTPVAGQPYGQQLEPRTRGLRATLQACKGGRVSHLRHCVTPVAGHGHGHLVHCGQNSDGEPLPASGDRPPPRLVDYRPGGC